MSRHSLIPRPQHAPITLLALYRRYTKDYKARAELVHTLLRQDTDQRVLVVSLVMKGYSCPQISGAMELNRRGVLRLVQAAMLRAWRIINQIPRYHKVGRKGCGGNVRNLVQYRVKEKEPVT